MVDRISNVGVIIVTFQSRKFIIQCLDSVINLNGIEHVVVVDNNSTDGTVEEIWKKFPALIVISLKKNIGFGAAVNIGIKEISNVPFYFFLNPDSIVESHSILKLRDFAELNPDVGIIGPRVYDDPDKKSVQLSCRRFPSIIAGGIFNKNSLFSKIFKGNSFTNFFLYLDTALNQPSLVDWVSGCAMWVRREVIEDIGNFDEGFFFFCEDIDLCWRANKKGWKVLIFPKAEVIHFIGKSAEFIPYEILKIKRKSMVRLYKKHIRRTVFTDPFILVGGWIQLGFRMLSEFIRGLKYN